MNNFELLKNKITSKSHTTSKENIIKDILNVKYIDDSFKNHCVKYEEIKKEPYSFRVCIVPKKIPTKNQNSHYQLDYKMEEHYFLKIFINDVETLCEVTINNSKDNNILFDEFNKWTNLINDKPIDHVFDVLLSLL